MANISSVGDTKRRGESRGLLKLEYWGVCVESGDQGDLMGLWKSGYWEGCGDSRGLEILGYRGGCGESGDLEISGN